MIVIPAVDLRAGACVQLVGGDYEAERVRIEDPLIAGRSWLRFGFRHLHVVDLDAATGRGSNHGVVHELLREAGAEVQVGGGVRSEERIDELLGDGAHHVIVGTRAVEDAGWLADMASAFPGDLIVAADVRDRRLTTQGWTRTFDRHVLDLVGELNSLPLAGLLVTAVHREGQMRGTDLSLMEDVAEASEFPVYAAGGVSSVRDLRLLAERGIAAAVVGMALYTGALDPWRTAEEFSE
jgi:phosphoribosylformimino-5-aminoimidazole carboxamide ribotide isomerase